MRHGEGTLRAGCHRLLLVETSGVAANGRTRAFYANLGHEEERVPGYWAGDDMVLCRKVLSAS